MALSALDNVKSFETFQDQQWQLFQNYQSGVFSGIQTGYDPENVDVADYMYTEIELVKSKSNFDAISHRNGFVLGEIRADCETCFDSERLVWKDAGVYRKGMIRSRVCANINLRGPALTPRGLSAEFWIRHDDGRIRVLLAYAPLDFQNVQGTDDVLCAVKLSDIVVVREKTNGRPLKADINPDTMWKPTSLSCYNGKFAGKRQRFSNDGEMKTEDISLDSFPTVDTDISLDIENENNDEINFLKPFSRIFDGGLSVQIPWILCAGVESKMRVSWMPNHDKKIKTTTTKDELVIYSTEISCTSFDNFVKRTDGSVGVANPTVTDYYVDTIYPI